MQEFINQLQEAHVFIKNNQDKILEYIRNTSFSLEDRWKIWMDLVEKSKNSYIVDPGESEGPIMTELMNYINENDFDRHLVIDYEFLLNIHENRLCDEAYDNDSNFYTNVEYDQRKEHFKVQLDELKEEILISNFGSYSIDW